MRSHACLRGRSAALSVFNNDDPNGTWLLYVQDEAAPDEGSLISGWFLTIETTGPSITPIPANHTGERADRGSCYRWGRHRQRSNLIVTATQDAETPAGLISSWTLTGDGANRFLDIRPALNMPSLVSTQDGTANYTVKVTDGTVTNTVTFVLTVKYVDQGTVVTGLTNVTTAANQGIQMPITLSDVDTPVANVQVTALASRPTGSVSVSGSGSSRTVTFIPNNNLAALGDTVISVVATGPGPSGSSSTNTFTVTVTAAPLPAIVDVPNQVMPINGTLSVNVTVLNSTPTTQVVAANGNTNVIANIAVNGVGGTWTVTLTAVPNAQGPATITLVASSEWGVASDTFQVSVLAASQPPVISQLNNVTTRADLPVSVNFSVTDPDTANVTVSASASRDTGTILLSGTPAAQTLRFTPNNNLNSLGDTIITVRAFDGVNTVTSNFTVNVTSGPLPAISPISDKTAPAGGILVVSFTVTNTSQNTVVRGLTSSSLVSSIDVTGDGTNYSATINLVPGTNGVANITILAATDWGTATEAFQVTVTPGENLAELGISRSGNQLTIAIAGEPNTTYNVQTSTTLTSWTTGPTVTTDANGNATFTAPIGTGTGTFYRLLQQ
jgi:hypothetical protein